MRRHQFTRALTFLAAVLTRAARVSHSLVADIDGEPWNTAFQTPNATSDAIFQGIDLLQPYPGEPSGDWKWTIQVRDDIPRPNGRFTTGTWIRLQVPASSVNENRNGTSTGNSTQVGPFVEADPSWAICMAVWRIQGFMTDDDAEDPGSCNGILPDDCISSLMTQISQEFSLRRDGEVDCPSIIMPPECEGTFEDLTPPGVDSVGFQLEGSPSTSDGVVDIEKTARDGDEHEIGNFTAYKASLRQVHIIGQTWGYSNLSDETSRDLPVRADLFCLRAATLKEGSTSTASRGIFSYVVWWTLLSFAITIGLSWP